jgi:MFS family permease
MPAVVYLAGGIVFLSFLVEGTSATWSGLYLRNGLHAREAVAALAYPLLQVAMIAGRLAGDPLRARVGTRRVLVGAGLGVAASFTLVTTASWWWLAIAGFVAAGLTIAPVVPLGFSVAGAADPTGSGTGIARAAGMAYTGTLAGPVVVGFLAEVTSLRGALVLAVVLGLGICLLGRALPGER